MAQLAELAAAGNPPVAMATYERGMGPSPSLKAGNREEGVHHNGP